MRRIAYLLVALSCASGPNLHGQSRAPAPQRPARVRLAPQFAPGQTFRYALDSRTSREGDTAGVMDNPVAPKKTEMAISAIVRFDVLRAVPDTARPGSAAGFRLRATYEKLATTAHADVHDPQLAEGEAQLHKLEGRAIEFTVAPNGEAADIQGLGEIFPDDREAVRDLLAQLSFGPRHPGEGIVPEQKWTAEQPMVSAPLAGLAWRTESTYLRNEPCRASGTRPPGSSAPAPLRETCAVILSRYEMVQHGRPRDPTPEEFRQRGLHTTGKMAGTGESLAYVSLETGLVVSVTHSSAQETDLTVSTADGESSLRQQIRVRSQAQITLLPETPVSSR